MTRTLLLSIFVIAALVIAAMWFAATAHAGAPTYSPPPQPRPPTQLDQLARSRCEPRKIIIAKLVEKYGETWRGGGLADPTAIFEIWASDVTGTWTILKTTPNGFTCAMAVGYGWRDFTGKLTPIGNPA